MSSYWGLLKLGSIIRSVRQFLAVQNDTLGVVYKIDEDLVTVVFEGGAIYDMYHTDLERYVKLVAIDPGDRAPKNMSSALPTLHGKVKTLSMFKGLYDSGKFNKYFAIGRHLLDNRPSSHLLEEELV